MTATNGSSTEAISDVVQKFLARGWHCVPVHRPLHSDHGTTCSCGKDGCRSVGKHPDARFWPGGTHETTAYRDRNVGVFMGVASKNLADVDKDCTEALAVAPFLLPPSACTFGRGGQETHSLYTIAGEVAFAKTARIEREAKYHCPWQRLTERKGFGNRLVGSKPDRVSVGSRAEFR